MLAAAAATVTARRSRCGEEVGREDVTTFFRTRPDEEVKVGGFVIVMGERSRFNNSIITDERTVVKGTMARILPLFYS